MLVHLNNVDRRRDQQNLQGYLELLQAAQGGEEQAGQRDHGPGPARQVRFLKEENLHGCSSGGEEESSQAVQDGD